MRKSKNDIKIINQLAKEHEKSSSEIREKMEEAILSGFTSTNPEVKASWEKLFGKGKQPTMEDFLKQIRDSLK